MSATVPPRAFRFGDYTLDLAGGSLRAGDRPIELRPKTFAVLAYLVQNAGRLVSKDEVMRAVWSDVVVSDESLTKCVSEVRAALGDRDQRFVKTVPRRGYLFGAPVLPEDRTVDSGAQPSTPDRIGGFGLSQQTASATAFPRRRAR